MSREQHLKTDFHALRVLAAVYEHGSISDAADFLDMSQSTVSYTIERLRGVFSDPLFVKQGRRIRPTRRCDDVAGGARELLQLYERMVVPTEFDPALSTETFVLSCNYYERGILLAPLVQRLRQFAPNVRLTAISADGDGMRQLEQDLCDVVISPIGDYGSGSYCEQLLAERYACFVSHDSPWCDRRMDLDSYVNARHIHVRPSINWRPYFHTALDRLGVSISPQVEVCSFGDIDKVIEGTDLVLTATEGFSRIYSTRIVCVRAPFDCSFSIHMGWTGRTHRSPAHIWFRSLLREIAHDLPKPSSCDMSPVSPG